MILEYAALAGGAMLAGGALTLIGVLVLAGRANDEGVYEAGELAATRYPPGPDLSREPPAAGAGPPPPVPPADHPACPDCDGRRCAAWRHRGTRCGDPVERVSLPAYAVGLPLPRDGRHATPTVVARWLAGSWWDTPMPVRLRRQLGRMVGATRVPVQLGYPLQPLP